MIILSAGRAEEKSELTAQKLGASVHSPTLLYPRPQGAFFFYLRKEKGPSHKLCAAVFAQPFFPLPFFCFFEKAGNTLHFVVFNILPRITTT